MKKEVFFRTGSMVASLLLICIGITGCNIEKDNENSSNEIKIELGEYDSLEDMVAAYVEEHKEEENDEIENISKNVKYESQGYDSPESALTAYINALREQDVKKAMSTFAIESYAKNYSLVEDVERNQCYGHSSSSGMVEHGEISSQILVENRRAKISEYLRVQYLLITESPCATDYFGQLIPVKEFGTARALLEEVCPNNEEKAFSDIKIVEFIDPQCLIGDPYIKIRKDRIEKSSIIDGSEGCESIIAKIETDLGTFYLFSEALKYDGKWYNNNSIGVAGSLYGGSPYGVVFELE